jgi:hypothetical protein
MRRRIRAGSRKTWKTLGLMFVVAVSSISIAGYVALSITLDGQPSPSQSFPGWIALIQPASESLQDKVQLRVVTSNEGSSNPFVTYTVSACGPHPYSADLLLTGGAELSAIAAQFAISSGSGATKDVTPKAEQLSLEYINEYVSGGENTTEYLGSSGQASAQLFHVSDRFVLPCSIASQGQPNNTLGESFGDIISGSISAPMQQSWSGLWGWWHGPHASESWPTTGGLGPGIDTSGPESLTFQGLSGSWVVPAARYEVTSDDIPATWSMDSSAPTTSAPNAADWLSTSQISPTAQFTDTASTALLQDWIVVCAVGLGVGGGMLATLLLEWFRPKADDLTASASRDPSLSSSSVGATQKSRRMHRRTNMMRWLAAIGIAFFTGYVRGYLHRRNP